MKELFFTRDFYLIPSSLKVFEDRGEFYAFILRDCPICSGQQLSVDDCSACNGSGIATPEKERLIKLNSTTIFEELPIFLKCPDLDRWKQSNAMALKLLNEDGSDFAVGLKRQIDAGLFLTTRQLQSFNTSFNQHIEAPEIVKTLIPKIASTSPTDAQAIGLYKEGDVVKIIVTFTEIRAQYSKTSGCKFFTYTGLTNLGGFAFTNKSQHAVELGECYTLAGKIRHFFTYDSIPYAITSVTRLTRNATTA